MLDFQGSVLVTLLISTKFEDVFSPIFFMCILNDCFFFCGLQMNHVLFNDVFIFKLLFLLFITAKS